VKFIQNIGNLVEFTFEIENFPIFSQLSSFIKEIHPKKTLKKTMLIFFVTIIQLLFFCEMTQIRLVIGRLW
jgi:hypothetical protein